MKTFNSIGVEKVPNQNHTSKGDQPKWFIGNEWYKADYMGYESLSEVVVSAFLNKSNITEFVKYEPIKINTGERVLNGCVSKNFKNTNESLITLEKLHRMYFGIGLADKISKISDTTDKIKYTVDFVVKITGLKEFGQYLSTMLAIDAVFLNEDRHTNNIAVIRNETTHKYRLCPFFDNGLSLLSDLNDYPFAEDVYKLIDSVRAKPFDIVFDEQLDAAEKLYGSYLQIDFSVFDIESLFESFTPWYSFEVVNRVKKVLLERRRKYQVYFK